MGSLVENRGLFWWLGEPIEGKKNLPDSSVSGLLTISDEGRIELKLDEGLLYSEDLFKLSRDAARLLPRGRTIAGRLSESGRSVIAQGLSLTDFPWIDESSNSQSYEAESCLISEKSLNEHPRIPKFDHLLIELKGLEEWLGLDSIYPETVDIDGDSHEVSVKYINHKFEYKVATGDLWIRTLTSSPVPIFFDHPTGKAVFEQTHWLEYAPHAKFTLESLEIDFTHIEELFSILLGSYFRLAWPIVFCEY